MDVTDEPRREPNLSAEAFQLLLTRLAAEPEAAGREYERLRRGLANYFRLKGFFHCLELADLTLDRVAHLITTKDVSDLGPFSFGVARLVCLEQYRAEQREYRANEGFAASAGSESEESLYELMRQCIATLAPPDQELLKAYFTELSPKQRSAHREQLAQSYRISLERLRLRIHRLRRKLEDCLNQSRAK